MGCDGNQQATMDSEIAYAKASGLSYWAYAWYKPDSSMLNGWALDQSSQHKADMNWTIIAGYGLFHLDMTRAAGYSTPEQFVIYFAQSNFEKTSGRPLLYLLADPSVASAVLKKDVGTLRDSAEKAHVGNPYIAILH